MRSDLEAKVQRAEQGRASVADQQALARAIRAVQRLTDGAFLVTAVDTSVQRLLKPVEVQSTMEGGLK
jgi:hypothetical protein